MEKANLKGYRIYILLYGFLYRCTQSISDCEGLSLRGG